MSYELIADWNRRLTRTPPLILHVCPAFVDRFAFLDHGLANKFKIHGRDGLAMAFVQRFCGIACLGECTHERMRREMRSNSLNQCG
jgi:hypothetical protein